MFKVLILISVEDGFCDCVIVLVEQFWDGVLILISVEDGFCVNQMLGNARFVYKS